MSIDDSAPHPAFGHPLPASRGEGAATFCVVRAFSPQRGEKVREARMRGVSSKASTGQNLSPTATRYVRGS
jgi:hypothetical protein